MDTAEELEAVREAQRQKAPPEGGMGRQGVPASETEERGGWTREEAVEPSEDEA